MKQNEPFTKFLLGDDHHIVRQGLELVIEDLHENAQIIHASSLQQIREYAGDQPFDYAVLDAQFPDGNSLHLIPELKHLQPELKIMVFTSFEEEDHALKFLDAGADGFLSKLSTETEIRNALEKMVQEGFYHSEIIRKLKKISARNPKLINPLHQLSERELQIAELYALGHGNLEISNALSLKPNTISTFKKRIFEKLNVQNMLELAEIVKTHAPHRL